MAQRKSASAEALEILEIVKRQGIGMTVLAFTANMSLQAAYALERRSRDLRYLGFKRLTAGAVVSVLDRVGMEICALNRRIAA